MNTQIRFKLWKKSSSPRKVLAIRFQALGDTIITLPYLQSLKRQYPEIQLHFLTRKEVKAIPGSINIFNKVIAIGGGRNAKLQFVLALLKLPYLLLQRYDIVLDLQNNKISIIVRKLLRAAAWSEFDKYSSQSAGGRTQATIEAPGAWKVFPDSDFKINFRPQKLLGENGWDGSSSLVALNPAGYSPARNWPLHYYIGFAKCWVENINANTQFVLLLLPSMAQKSDYIKHSLGDRCIDLTGKANQIESFAILKKCKFVLSEDSGLMHMAWVQGIPTIALFSSSRKDWSAPQGELSFCFDSSDMACGPCGLEVCKYGDNRCLVRYEPEVVILKAKEILKRSLKV